MIEDADDILVYVESEQAELDRTTWPGYELGQADADVQRHLVGAATGNSAGCSSTRTKTSMAFPAGLLHRRRIDRAGTRLAADRGRPQVHT